MDLEMVLNELSLRSPANDAQVARERMSDLVNTMVAATKLGVKKVLRTHKDFSSEELAPDYPVARWRNDHMVDQVARSYFRTLATKAPYLMDLDDPKIGDMIGLSDFLCDKDKAPGLGIAFLLDALALSLRSEPRWHSSRIELNFMQLDNSGEIIDEQVETIHASCREHVLEHSDWIKNRISIGIRNGLDLWMHREEIFPNLQFCELVERQIRDILHGDLPLQPILKRLLDLENYCNDWYHGPFDPQKISGKITMESLTTLNMYRQEHTFRCPDGTDRIFSWHSRITPGAWRIYFFPQEERGEIIIGYIGSHLPTVSYPT